MTKTPLNSKCLALFFVLLVTSVNAAAQDNKASLLIYKKRCSWCHGIEGKGDGPASKFISPPPRNFTLGLNKFVSTVPSEITLPSDRDIYRAISNGLPGTAMKAWKDLLTKSEIQGLVKVVKGFTDIYSFENRPATLPLAGKIPVSKNSLKKGRFLFRSAGCFECHGEEGRGDGNKLLRRKSGARIWPRNLTKPWTFKGGNAPEDIFRRISTGLPGTPMPAFGLKNKPGDSVKRKTLSVEERWNLVNFVLSLKDNRYKNVDSIIEARYISGKLPGSIRDKRWKKAKWTSLYLAPNLIEKKRLFNPLNDIIRVKALFNDNTLALLLAWSDRSKSLPLGKNLEKLGGEKLYEDSVAVKFPVLSPSGVKHAYLGHQNKGAKVTLWQWKSGTTDSPETAIEQKGNSSNTAQLYSKGVYENGEWSVLIKNVPAPSLQKAVYKTGKYIPIAFAGWDGSNGEKGSKHTFTRWGNIYLTPTEDWKKFLKPAAGFLILISIQLGIRKRIAMEYNLTENC